MAERYYANGMREAALLEGATGDRAVLFTGAAVTVADSGAAWLAHANALLAQAARDNQPSADLQRRAILAATNAALRLDSPAPALVTLADALEKRFRGEDALAAIRLAEALRPGIAPDLLTELRDKYGFRLLSHDVGQQQRRAAHLRKIFRTASGQSRLHAFSGGGCARVGARGRRPPAMPDRR